uniref:Retrotransposon gag domain-containing protein n=1 Tax=Tanacetum cinerariifolium TaxID=118510 RepID=A0A699HIJ6_TANCI|nr:hypothetical protein [Tanacetum cinerariifolium]
MPETQEQQQLVPGKNVAKLWIHHTIIVRLVAEMYKSLQALRIWKAFGGNTPDLGSFEEETDKTTDLHQHLSRFSTQKLETASQITSITTWEDLTTRFLAQFFPPRRTAKLRNDILMFQQHHEESLSEAWTRFKDLEERSGKTDETLDNTVKPTVTESKTPVKEDERKNETKNKPIKKAEKKEVEKVLSSRPVEYYLKHRINEKLIEGLVDNNRFNDSLSRDRVGKENIKGKFEIPCIIEGLKYVNALVNQGSDVNVMPYSTYMKLTNEMPAETNIRLLLASHSYIYPLGIADDILVEVAEHVYPIDFVILDIKENKKRPFILGTPFLTTAKVEIKFDKGIITLRSIKSMISFHRIPDSPCMTKKGVKNDIKPIAPTITMNRLVLKWEEKIKLHLEREMDFNQ